MHHLRDCHLIFVTQIPKSIKYQIKKFNETIQIENAFEKGKKLRKISESCNLNPRLN